MKNGFLRVKNRSFGGTYKAYGLLTLDDFAYALSKAKLKNYDSIVLHGIFLNRDKFDLRRNHLSQLTGRFNIPFIVR